MSKRDNRDYDEDFLGKVSKNPKLIVMGVLSFILLVATLISLSNIFETCNAGWVHVKQAAITGKMTVKMTPGVYLQMFGDITKYKRVATVGFGDQKGEGSADIDAIAVIFNDGSKATIDGLVRIQLPDNPDQIRKLKEEYSEGYDHFIRAGIVPIVKNAVKLSANLRSAQDAYTTIALFQQAIEDQLRFGIYETRSDTIERIRSTGDVEKIQVTVIVKDENGKPKRISNRLSEIGCEVKECVISVPNFDAKVEEMISKRKDEAMKTELAKQEAIRAKQDAITAEEKGKAEIEKARATELVLKIQATTEAQKEYEVSKLNRLKADEDAKANLIKKKAEAEANRLLVSAGLTPLERATIQKETAIGVAEQMSKIKFPELMILGGGDGAGGTDPFKAIGLESYLNILDSIKTSK